MDEQVQSILVSTETLYHYAPELPFVFRFLAQGDYSLFQWVINGPPGYDQFEFRNREDKVDILTDYLIGVWESTNTLAYDIDTAHYGNKISSMASDYLVYERVIKSMMSYLYSLLSLPSDKIFIHSFSRFYSEPELVGEVGYGIQQPIYYVVNFSTLKS